MGKKEGGMLQLRRLLLGDTLIIIKTRNQETNKQEIS